MNRFNEAFTYIAAIDPCAYARAFTESSSGRSSSQLIESLWAAIVFERAHPLTSLYLGVIQKFSQWVEKHRFEYVNNIIIFFVFSYISVFILKVFLFCKKVESP